MVLLFSNSYVELRSQARQGAMVADALPPLMASLFEPQEIESLKGN
jgi:hypothetical protein